ncbi:MAG TPA: hypothetical protein VN260_10830 [Dissulfurispiraceae bacterium]|nr:hypothetical protein [Dissulfurispiraceae bacterium]
MGYSCHLPLPLSQDHVFPFFHDLDTWFRLNPQWAVLDFARTAEAGAFALKVKYDRSEEEVIYNGTVGHREQEGVVTVRLEGETTRIITVQVLSAGAGSVLNYIEDGSREPTPEDKREINLWLKSVGDYIEVSKKSGPWSRLWKWFLDKMWLKMSPSGRRIVFFIVAGEAISFVFFILLLVWLIFFKRI